MGNRMACVAICHTQSKQWPIPFNKHLLWCTWWFVVSVLSCSRFLHHTFDLASTSPFRLRLSLSLTRAFARSGFWFGFVSFRWCFYSIDSHAFWVISAATHTSNVDSTFFNAVNNNPLTQLYSWGQADPLGLDSQECVSFRCSICFHNPHSPTCSHTMHWIYYQSHTLPTLMRKILIFQ